MLRGAREIHGAMTEIRVSRVEGKCARIVKDRGHARRLEVRPERIALRRADHVKMEDMGAIRPGHGMTEAADGPQFLRVSGGEFLATFRPTREVRQLRAQDGRLDAVEPAVDALHDVVTLATVPGKQGRPFGQPPVIGD